jgi:glycosyltransferase involved in cell wall biosynthesis
MNKPIISYVIPCYNCETTIFDTIDSIRVSRETIRKQKNLPSLWEQIEVIAVNDGSTDSTLDILNAISEQHPNVKVINLPNNKGKGIARNTGNNFANADIIAVLDSDDWNIHDRTDTIIKLFSRCPEKDIFYSSFVAKHTYNGHSELKTAEKISEKQLKEFGTFGICHSSVAYRKKAILEQPYSEDRNKDDWAMLWNFYSKGYKFFFYAEKPLVAYRVNQQDIDKAKEHYNPEFQTRLKSKKMEIISDYFSKKDIK